MKHFVTLFEELDQTNKTLVKVQALVRFFENASDADKLWAIAILSHKRPKRTVKTAWLREWSAELADLPLWLFEESYHVVGDLAETIALILPPVENHLEKSLEEWIRFLKELKGKPEEEIKQQVKNAWMMMLPNERFVFNKLITGGFRMGVSQKLMTRALAKYSEIDEKKLAHRLMGKWTPDTTTFHDLVLSKDKDEDASRPYPFYLAYALDKEPQALGSPEEWSAEHKWDGIRGQLVFRDGKHFVWSRGEELVTEKYPEYELLLDKIPEGTVIDGEILPYKNDTPLSFNDLQTRIGRKNLTKKILDKAPVVFMSYDLLEWKGEDLRLIPFIERRKILHRLVAEVETSVLMISEEVEFNDWNELREEREVAREKKSEGLMLKKYDSIYDVGRKKGSWWKWKVDPLTVDAVMIYAMRGHGRRANLYTDYTFAVWKGDELVPFAKAYSGLTDKEIREVDRFVKNHTVDRFGPVRSVTPELVFELAFEGIHESSRHKSGIALRFPRISRWRRDKKTSEANTLEDLHDLLNNFS